MNDIFDWKYWMHPDPQSKIPRAAEILEFFHTYHKIFPKGQSTGFLKKTYTIVQKVR